MVSEVTSPLAAGDIPSVSSAPAPKFVVGIGASAGGLEALERFFDRLPDDTGMAFVVVQHLSPDFKTMMDELLARHTALPVRLVEDGMPVEANHVYLIPPGKEMIISGGRLLLTERDKQQELTLPIDVFFRSLAQDCGRRAVAIVLSGGGSDGSRGVRAVHDCGGLVLVQDTESAQFDGMPKKSRETGVANRVLAPGEMPAVLLELAREANLRPIVDPGRRASRSKLEAIYEMLEQEFGIDFTNYKPSTVTRRIERRLALARAEDLERYIERLRGEREELDVLYRDLLIGVTRFFRNEEAFEMLEQRVLPDLLRRGAVGSPLRIWGAGGATGEEAYSIAIAAHETAMRLDIDRPVKVFATDVHHGSLARAARGVYDEEALANVSRDRAERYFQKSGRSYQIVPEIRQTIVFAPHNVIKDAPFTRVDLVSCRNLLIYLQPPAQQKVLSLFHFALNRGGVLFLGPSESPSNLSHDYETIDKHWRVFRKFSDVRVPVEPRFRSPRSGEPRSGSGASKAPFGRNAVSHLLGTYDALLDEFMPPSLLVDDRGELLHAFAGASRFLRPHDGRQGLDLVDLVADDLKTVLVVGIKRALAEPHPVVYSGIVLDAGDGRVPHKVTLRRLSTRIGTPPHVLVSFEASGEPSLVRAPASETIVAWEQVSREQLSAVEAELSATKENLQAAIEELEASNEELQASNEELLASNEELQSTNEELQSVNEELYTVNAEHQRKIAELVELTNDMDNLLSSTDIGTIFLDQELRIRKFTPQIAQTFNLVPHDAGRSIETFAHSMHHPELVGDLRACLATGERVERELRDARGKTFFLRILPYRAKGQIGGVVLTTIDVTGMKAAEDALFRERHLLDSLLSSVPDAIYFKDARGGIVRANQAIAERGALDDPDQAAADERVMRTGMAQNYSLERRVAEGGEERWDLVTRLPMHDRSGHVVGVIVISRDVTSEKRAEAKIQEAVRRRDQFLAMLSHELRNPLSAIVTATRLLRLKGDGEGSRELDTLERQSTQMARLLDDLLEASRVTQNKIDLRKQVVDLAAVTKEAVDVVRPLVASRGHRLTVDIEPRPILVHGDPARLQQIQVNLLTNAAKYTAPGGHIELRVRVEGGDAVVRVRDDGVGISKEMLGSVFELFVQASRTVDRSDGGLGVGLTLVRALVALHGGTVTAHSDGIGKGSEFTVRIPIAEAATAATTDAPRGSRPPSERGARNRSKVVIVEDNDDIRHTLARYLEQAGFRCVTASSGLAALGLVRDTRPDVAIIDLGLPGMDGLELARRLRGDPALATLQLIALTGYGQPHDREAVERAGFDAHMVKPVDLDALVARLETTR